VIKLSSENSKKSDRKKDHIEIALKHDVVPKRFISQFDEVVLIHEALPSLDSSDIDMTLEFIGKKLSAPLIVGAMTGGTAGSEVINGNIAEAVEELGLGMGIGSQKLALGDSSFEYTFAIARRKAPNAVILGNLGASNVFRMSRTEIRRAVEMIQADALEIHLNALQEFLQPEGEPNFKGLEEKLDQICDEAGVPVFVKETGSGISMETAKRLNGKKISGFDIGGAGGTSFAVIEGKRRNDDVAEPFYGWGIPTAASIMEVRSVSDKLIIASGGVRSGLDAVKAMVLGATLSSMARPLLRPATRSSDEVKNFLVKTEEQIRIGMALTGSRDLKALMKVKFLLMGDLAQWVRQRGIFSL